MSSFLSKLFFFKRNSTRSGCPSATTTTTSSTISSTLGTSTIKHKHQPLPSPFSPTFVHVTPKERGASRGGARSSSSYRRPLSIVNEQYQEIADSAAVYTGPTERERAAVIAEVERVARMEVLLSSQVLPPSSSSPPRIALLEEEEEIAVEAERHSGDSSATVSSFSSYSPTTTNSETFSPSGNIRVGGHRVKANHFFADFQLGGFTSKETTVRLFFSRSIVVNCSHKEEDRESGASEFRTFMRKVMLPPAGTVVLQHISCKVYPCGLMRVQVPYRQGGALLKEKEGDEEVQVVLTEVTNIHKRRGKCSHHY